MSLALEARPGTALAPRSARPARPARALLRPLAACAVLMAVYVGLSFLNDTQGYLGTDTGSKVATLRAMARNGGLDPDVGYWAERWDPKGRSHPLYYTVRIGKRWVNATTLPMLLAAYPLYRLGGYRAALVLPMLGSVLAALAARALARRLGREGWPAFWVVGLASPVTIYALDLWEHSLGVALMAWAVVHLLDGLEDGGNWRHAAAAGLLFGTAATMRTEALAYAVAATVVGGAVLSRRGRLVRRAPVACLVLVAAMALPLLGNAALEQATVGGQLRSGRAAATAVASGRGTVKRAREAAVTAVSEDTAADGRSVAVGGLVLALLVVASRRPRRAPARLPALATAGVALLYGVRFAHGLDFVPGMVAATPLAAVGLARGWGTSRSRTALALALGALPLVWATQFSGGAAPQWGGRYVLTTGLLLAVAGAVALPRLPRGLAIGAVVLSVGVTAHGLAWLSVRSHDVASTSAELAARPEPVLVSRVAHLAREGGAFSGLAGDRRWLTAVSDADERRAVEVVRRAGLESFAVVELSGAASSASMPAPTGCRVLGRDRLRFLPGTDLEVTSCAVRR